MTAFSGEEYHAPAAKAFGLLPTETPVGAVVSKNPDLWEYFERPDQKERLLRFGLAMEATSRLEPPDTILRGFAFGTLPEGAIVVDVGGGIGAIPMVLAKNYQGLKFVVQDRAKTVEDGIKARSIFTFLWAAVLTL